MDGIGDEGEVKVKKKKRMCVAEMGDRDDCGFWVKRVKVRRLVEGEKRVREGERGLAGVFVKMRDWLTPGL